jgi:hypothetical protein
MSTSSSNTGGDPTQGSSTPAVNIQKHLYNATEQLVAQLKQLNSYYANVANPDSANRLQDQLVDSNNQQANMKTVAPEQALESVGGRGGLRGFASAILGGSGANASIPPGMTEAQYKLQPSPIPNVNLGQYNEGLSEGIKIPQFGDWQLNDKLQYARDLATRVASFGGYNQADIDAYNQGDMSAAPSTIGRVGAAAAGLLQRGYQNAATLHLISSGVKGVLGQGESFHSFGANLGYNPTGSSVGPSTVLGFRNPLSLIPGLGTAASTQGSQAFAQEMILRTNAGISGEAAKQIIDSLGEQGFSGNALDNLSQNLSVPLVQQGMSPEIASQFANATRNGDTSIQQLSDSLKNFGQIAIETREPINQAAESLLAFMQTAEEFGSTQGQAAATGTQFSTITGLDPQILGEEYSNPLYQGYMMSQYGIMPSGLATADTGTQTAGMLGVLKLAMNSTSGLDTPTYRMIDGVRVMVQTGRERQIAQAAQLVGQSPAIAERLWRNQGRITAASRASSLLNSQEGWQNEMKKMEAHGATLTGHEMELLNSGKPDSEGGDSWVSWAKISNEARKAGVSAKDLAAYSKDPLHERANDLNAALRKVGKQQIYNNQQKVGIQFTGAAAKWFKQNTNATTLTMHAGGELTSNHAADPMLDYSTPVH